MCETIDQNRRNSVSLAVIDAVAAATDTPTNELPPLADVVDPDALDALFVSSANPPSSDRQLTFQYVGCTVVVDGDGTVSIPPTTEESATNDSVTVRG